ncbi:methylated-DNA--[protein]-cysteine S-methyltransferase [Nitrosococcus oceani]|uniref:methylated-DNA--[protein]-cysteine S-methyltransferase n=1 Tax=Nitrosococcus oceani TaxID=1229 RepID=UPI000AD1E5BE|nr:methylated-DNA--[protein]-cysteine S-methyltransferase [Nitrosococcus oceani]
MNASTKNIQLSTAIANDSRWASAAARDSKVDGKFYYNVGIRFAIGQCSLGATLVAQSNRGICAIFLDDNAEKLVHDLEDQFPRANLVGGDAQFEQLIAEEVVGFIEAPSIGLNLPLDIRGTAFQQRVWRALREIPAGSTASYSAIARHIGAPKSARAVARACAVNTLAVAIPCHRVVRSNGKLSGYRWGLERKRTLLKKEADEFESIHTCQARPVREEREDVMPFKDRRHSLAGKHQINQSDFSVKQLSCAHQEG